MTKKTYKLVLLTGLCAAALLVLASNTSRQIAMAEPDNSADDVRGPAEQIIAEDESPPSGEPGGDGVPRAPILDSGSSRISFQALLTDDQGVNVSCPTATLDEGATMTCTATGVAVDTSTLEDGVYVNIGTVTADELGPPGPGGRGAGDSDPSHYTNP